MPSGVHDSALIVNAFRASKPHVSADKFAALWVTEEIENWANKYAEQVGRTEIIVHALRHRFFLECLQQFFDKHPNGVFINIGAGFTNYPYLISSQISCCEIDTEININFKSQKLANFESKGDLPPRVIKFISVNDLNKPAEISSLESNLREWINNRPSFVLFEGIFFYIKMETIGRLYRILSDLQNRGDIVASTSFRPEECTKSMFQRLLSYCKTGYRMKCFTPTLVPTSFYSQHQFYSLLTHKNYYHLSREYNVDEKLINLEEVLEEDAYILERK